MYNNITNLYKQSEKESNLAGSNKFNVKYYDRRIEDDKYESKSFNRMYKVPYTTYMSEPVIDASILKNMNHEISEFYSQPEVDLTKPIYFKRENSPEPSYEPYIKIQKEVGLFPTTSPEVFGPPFWFTIHNGVAKYPDNPSPDTQNRMKNLILALPIIIPCIECREHATANIEKNKDRLDEITANRTSLFNFFVDFHNMINKFTNKPEISYEQALDMYTGKAEIEIIRVKS